MNKINNNLILFFPILSLILGIFSILPINAYAYSVTTQTGATYVPTPPIGYGCTAGDLFSAITGLPCPTSTVTNTNYTNTTTNTILTSNLNPIPTISQISPSSAPANSEVITITITGSKFVLGSMGRVNGEERTTNYIKDEKTGRIKSTVLTMVLTKEDLSSNKPLSITVFNPAPGGGTSNSITFNDKENKNNSDLAAGAIFGSDGFMPKTFVQWIMLIVLIIIGVVLFRKASKRKEKYHSTPLKHE